MNPSPELGAETLAAPMHTNELRTTATKRTSKMRGIAAATIGNTLEWFDIAVYALLAIYIGRNFFPSDNPAIEVIQAFAVFGVSYLVRPLGGLILGSYADRNGMKNGLMLTIRIMVVGTALLAFMPTYEIIGIWAPIGIIVARLLQGFAAGGEFGAATSFLIAQDTKRRGFLGSFQFASQGLGNLVAAIMVAVLTATLSADQMMEWGWRIPFIFGLLVGPAGYYIRKYVNETPIDHGPDPETSSPVRYLFRTQKIGILIAVGALSISTSLNYLLHYLPTFGIQQLGLPASASFTCAIITSAILTFGTPFVGHFSDRYGRVRIMIPAAAIIGVAAAPIFFWLNSGRTFIVLATVMAILGLLKALYFGALPSVMSDAFDQRARATGLSFSYNSTVAVFGGFTPMVAAYLIEVSGQDMAPSYYLAVLACFSIAALACGVKYRGIR